MIQNPPPPKKKRRGSPHAKAEARRKILIDSARSLLAERSVPEISYPDIARHAGLPLSSCYYFYQSKLALVQAVDEQLGQEYRDEIMKAPLASKEISCWEDIVDNIVDRSWEHIQKRPAAQEIWYSGNVPTVIRERVAEREQALSIVFREHFDQHFVLPEIPKSEKVFFLALEMLEFFFGLTFPETEESAFILGEAKRAIKLYLRAYIPESLPRA